jgi:23S rRNA (cytidine1920-2'-O)/16S rRNA (cytidine1409-2'-O)-methyltransferase
MAKKRLDLILYERGLFSSRTKAATSIMSGVVLVDGEISDKPGTPVLEDAIIEIKEQSCPWVSRGGLKLEKAIKHCDLEISGKICMDIGASTGGFTQVLLENGAEKVYCVDVGYGQLDYKLRIDPRVVNMERTNIRYLEVETVEKIEFATIDVSFISLRLVFPVVKNLLVKNGKAIALVKPQFEAGREQVGKNGIVRDEAVRTEVLKKVGGYAEENGLSVQGVLVSPIKGAKGNIEYLMLLENE